MSEAEKAALRRMGCGGLGADCWLADLGVGMEREWYLFRVWQRWRDRFCTGPAS